jgi:hypothetical protein
MNACAETHAMNSNYLTSPAGSTPARFVPEFFPLPQRGQDPFFGVGRSFYYDLEKRGLLRLVRLRKPGNVRGKVLVPYADMLAAVRKLGVQEANSTDAAGSEGKSPL